MRHFAALPVALFIVAIVVLGHPPIEDGAVPGFLHGRSGWFLAEAFAAPPIARIRPAPPVDKNWPLGGSVVLDATESSDPDGDPLTYEWYGPFGTATGPKPSVFIPEGTYAVCLVVRDGQTQSPVAKAEVVVRPAFAVFARGEAGRATLRWTRQEHTNRYDIYRAQEAAPGDFQRIAEAPPTRTDFVDDTVKKATTYLYLVVSVVGDFSNGTWRFSNATSCRSLGGATAASPNAPPVVFSTPVGRGAVGATYHYDVNASDPDGDALRYALPESFGNMEIDPKSGLLTWAPVEKGTFKVAVQVTDERGAATKQDFEIQVAYAGEPTSDHAAEPLSDQKAEPTSDHAADGLAKDPQPHLFPIAQEDGSGPSGEDKKAREADAKDDGAESETPSQGHAPQISVEPLSYTVRHGETLIFHVSATDLDDDVVTLSTDASFDYYTFSATAGRLAKGTFAFRPNRTQRGTYLVPFVATDPSGLRAEKTVEITVTAPSEKTGERPVEKPVEKPAEKPVASATPPSAETGPAAVPAAKALSAPEMPYTVQLAAFPQIQQAEELAGRLRQEGQEAVVKETADADGRHSFKVGLGAYSNWKKASRAASELGKEKGREATVVLRSSFAPVTKSPPAVFSVRVAAFLDYASAAQQLREVQKKGYTVCLVQLLDESGQVWHGIQIGDYKDRASAKKAASRFKADEKADALIAPIDPFLLEVRKTWCSDSGVPLPLPPQSAPQSAP